MRSKDREQKQPEDNRPIQPHCYTRPLALLFDFSGSAYRYVCHKRVLIFHKLRLYLQNARVCPDQLLFRSDDYIPTDCAAQNAKEIFGYNSSEDAQLLVHHLFDFDFHFAEKLEERASFSTAINLNERFCVVLRVFHATAHYLLRRLPAKQVAAQQPSPQDYLNPVVERVAMIKHHLCNAAFAQHSIEFAYCTGCVRRVMQYAVGIDHVEALVSEWQTFSIRNQEIAALTINIEAMPRNLYGARRQINSRAACAAARKLQKVRAHAA